MRRFVIGDIHGCSKALRTLIEEIAPAPDDELIFLGDYVDRGPDSKGVIQQLIELRDKCRVIALRGNHEIMLWSVAYNGIDADVWLESGGRATVTSYGGSLQKIPESHQAFIRDLRPFYETQDAIFVHACYEPDVEMEQQSDALRYWTHLGTTPPEPHCSGKRVFVGHTPQASGDILNLGHLVCMDTYCFGTGYLTGLNLATNEVIQVDRRGFRRRVPAQAFIHFVSQCVRSIRSKLAARQPNTSHD